MYIPSSYQTIITAVFYHNEINNDEQTLVEYMHTYIKKNNFVGIDKECDILTQLIDTNDKYMTFNHFIYGSC